MSLKNNQDSKKGLHGGGYIKYYLNNSDGTFIFQSETELFKLKLDEVIDKITLHCTGEIIIHNYEVFFEEIAKVLNQSKDFQDKLEMIRSENRKLILELKRKEFALSEQSTSWMFQRSNKRYLPS